MVVAGALSEKFLSVVDEWPINGSKPLSEDDWTCTATTKSTGKAVGVAEGAMLYLKLPEQDVP